MTSRTSAKIVRKAEAYRMNAEDYKWGTLDLSKGQVSALKANLTRLAKKVTREEMAGQHIAAAAASLDHTVTFKDELPPEPAPTQYQMTEAIPAIFRVTLVREGDIADRAKVWCPKLVAELSDSLVGDSDRENILVVMVDRRNYVIGVNIAHTGTLGSCSTTPREIFKPAILANSAAIIIVHNHPSGNPEPSPEDIELTRKMYAAGELLDIELMDHIIIGERGRYVSLKERGRF